MIFASLAIAYLLGSTDGRNVRNRVRNQGPRVSSDDLGRKPTVQTPTCAQATDRLKLGPVDINDVIRQAEYDQSIGNNMKYFDLAFYGTEAIWSEGFTPEAEINYYKPYWEDGSLYWHSWKDYWPDNNLFSFPSDGTDPQWHNANQGGTGNCYFISSAAAVAEFPQLIYDVFQLTNEDNAAGIYGITFHIRGKPWVVDIDDGLVWDTYYATNETPAGLIFSTPFDSSGDMWGVILEKAWGKVKGSISTSGQGGFSATGIRSLVGAPYFTYYPEADTVDALYQLIVAADQVNFLMAAGTDGGGNDQETNSCGIAKSHAYSIITAFTMTDGAGAGHDMVMMRNPWGVTQYSGTWSKDDPNWTDALVAQVPFDLDPRTIAEEDGIFVLPKASLIWDNDCIGDFGIAHSRGDEGYTDDWFDATDVDEEYHYYKFQVPSDAIGQKEGDFWDSLYITIESYYYEMIPTSCFMENSGDSSSHPVFVHKIDRGNDNFLYLGGEDIAHNPTQIEAYDENLSPYGYSANDEFEIMVQYAWHGSPGNDYTVKVYSKHSHTIVNTDDAANTFESQLFTDGVNTPSEFTGNPFNVGDMVDTDRPQCEADMTCAYCGDTDSCSATTVPDDFEGGGDDNNGGGDDGGGDDPPDPPAEEGCTPLALPGEVYAQTITVSNYVAEWNGVYCSSDVWNGNIHYKMDDTHHFFYANNYGSWCWQFTDTEQDGRDLAAYEGGYTCQQVPVGDMQWVADQYQTQDIPMWTMYEGNWFEVTYSLAEVEAEGATVDNSFDTVNLTPDCTPIPLIGESYGPVIHVRGHARPEMNGFYCNGETWNGFPHFESATGMHFYALISWGYYNWQFDDRDNDGTNDWYNGGWFSFGGEVTYGDLTADPYTFWTFSVEDPNAPGEMIAQNLQLALIDFDVGYIGEEEEEEVAEPVDCTPSHTIAHALTITGHPMEAYSGKYCRMDDWGHEEHFETGDGYHFYHIDLLQLYGVYCWNFDDRVQDGTNDYSNGGFACYYDPMPYEDLVAFAAEQDDLMQVALWNMYHVIGIVMTCEVGECAVSEEESYGGGGEINDSIQNPDGSYQEAESIGELISMLTQCETIGEVIGVVFANLFIIFSVLFA